MKRARGAPLLPLPLRPPPTACIAGEPRVLPMGPSRGLFLATSALIYRWMQTRGAGVLAIAPKMGRTPERIADLERWTSRYRSFSQARMLWSPQWNMDSVTSCIVSDCDGAMHLLCRAAATERRPARARSGRREAAARAGQANLGRPWHGFFTQRQGADRGAYMTSCHNAKQP